MSKKVERGREKSKELREGRRRSQKVEVEMQGRDSRFHTSLYSFKSASGVEMIGEGGSIREGKRWVGSICC
jgi:hypothetical protein